MDDDGGEHTNSSYYERFWTKPIKVRLSMKRVKHKRGLKKAVFFGNMFVSAVKDLRGLHHKRIDSAVLPLRRR